MSKKPKLDRERIAEAVGCSESFEVRGEHISVKIYREGKEIKRVIRELSQEEIGDFVLLGQAEGQDIVHCIYIASRHCENFFERADGFVIKQLDKRFKKFITSPAVSRGLKVRVEFYERKK